MAEENDSFKGVNNNPFKRYLGSELRSRLSGDRLVVRMRKKDKPRLK